MFISPTKSFYDEILFTVNDHYLKDTLLIKNLDLKVAAHVFEEIDWVVNQFTRIKLFALEITKFFRVTNCVLNIGHMYFLNAVHFVGNNDTELIITLWLEQDAAYSVVLLRIYFIGVCLISRKTELTVIDHKNTFIAFADEKPVILIKNNLLDRLQTSSSFFESVLFDYVLWVVIFYVAHQLVNIVSNLKDSNFLALFQMHYKVLAVVWKVYVNQVYWFSILIPLLHVDFSQHFNFGKIGVCFQKPNGEAIDFILKNVGEIVLCSRLSAI